MDRNGDCDGGVCSDDTGVSYRSSKKVHKFHTSLNLTETAVEKRISQESEQRFYIRQHSRCSPAEGTGCFARNEGTTTCEKAGASFFVVKSSESIVELPAA
jgi:hypothetical protein